VAGATRWETTETPTDAGIVRVASAATPTVAGTTFVDVVPVAAGRNAVKIPTRGCDVLLAVQVRAPPSVPAPSTLYARVWARWAPRSNASVQAGLSDGGVNVCVALLLPIATTSRRPAVPFPIEPVLKVVPLVLVNVVRVTSNGVVLSTPAIATQQIEPATAVPHVQV
jgi:hypothetical protein